MDPVKFLTPDEMAERYRGEISLGTLRNWCSMRVGPSFVKIGKTVLYPVAEFDAWDGLRGDNYGGRSSDDYDGRWDRPSGPVVGRGGAPTGERV